MRGRMYGSTEKYALRMRTCPSAGSGIGVSATSKRSSPGKPCGRATRRISRAMLSMSAMIRPWSRCEGTCSSPARRSSIPNFWRTVVLVGEHTEEGALGIVLNRSSETLVEEALPELTLLADEMGEVHVGGPVQPSAIVVLADFAEPDRADVARRGVGRLPPGRDRSGRARRARDERASTSGYAGWGPGQLDGELEEGSWIVEPALPDDVFTDDPEGLWSAVLRRKGGPFCVLAAMPPDPSRN